MFASPVRKPETGARRVLECAVGVQGQAGRAGWRLPSFSDVSSDVRSNESVAQRARGAKGAVGAEEGCSLDAQGCSLGAWGCSIEPRKPRTGVDHHVHDKPAARGRVGGWVGRWASGRAELW